MLENQSHPDCHPRSGYADVAKSALAVRHGRGYLVNVTVASNVLDLRKRMQVKWGSGMAMPSPSSVAGEEVSLLSLAA